MRQPSGNAHASVDEALIAAGDGPIAHIRQHAELTSQPTCCVPDDWT
ncbi:hypothetical protein [Streptomyces flaveolus]